MKTLILLIALIFLSQIASAKTPVRGYVKKNGQYVAPHNRTSPDRTPFNNWSSKGNVNPYTGKKGTKEPYKKK
jgi:hypothetical protein